MVITSDILNKHSNFCQNMKNVSRILKKKPFLNSETEPRRFFGLESYQKMSAEKTEALFTYFKKFELGISDFNQNHCGFIDDCASLVNLFKQLKSDCGCAKITFYDKCFRGVMHTLGFVRNGQNLYILDSLGHNKNVNKDIINFHNNVIKNLYSNRLVNGLKNIIMNHNTQQPIDELTCNHWTLANIEALIKNLRLGKNINNKEELDSVLPKDINKILDEDKQFVLDRHSMYTSK